MVPETAITSANFGKLFYKAQTLMMQRLQLQMNGCLVICRGQWKGKASEIGSYILTEFRKCVDSADEFKSFLRNVDKFGPPVLPGA